MIIAKAFKGLFEGVGMNLKLKVSNNESNGQTTRLAIPSNVKDNLTFMAV